jgi:hypothetical protein
MKFGKIYEKIKIFNVNFRRFIVLNMHIQHYENAHRILSNKNSAEIFNFWPQIYFKYTSLLFLPSRLTQLYAPLKRYFKKYILLAPKNKSKRPLKI